MFHFLQSFFAQVSSQKKERKTKKSTIVLSSNKSSGKLFIGKMVPMLYLYSRYLEITNKEFEVKGLLGFRVIDVIISISKPI